MLGMDRLLFKVYFNGLGRRGEADTMAKLTLVHRDKSARAMQYIHYTMQYIQCPPNAIHTPCAVFNLYTCFNHMLCSTLCNDVCNLCNAVQCSVQLV